MNLSPRKTLLRLALVVSLLGSGLIIGSSPVAAACTGTAVSNNNTFHWTAGAAIGTFGWQGAAYDSIDAGGRYYYNRSDCGYGMNYGVSSGTNTAVDGASYYSHGSPVLTTWWVNRHITVVGSGGSCTFYFYERTNLRTNGTFDYAGTSYSITSDGPTCTASIGA